MIKVEKLRNSTINMYLNCPYAFNLYEIEEREGLSTKNFVLGKAYEESVISYYETSDFDFKKDIGFELEKDFDYLVDEEKKDIEKNMSSNIEIATSSIEFYIENIGKNYELVHKQIEIKLNLEDVLFRISGHADSILKNKETGELISPDFKSSKNKMSSISFPYKKQLALYSMFLKNMRMGIHVFIKTKKPQAYELFMSDSELKQYQKIVHQVAIQVSTLIMVGNYEPTGLGKKDEYGNKPMCLGCLQRLNCKYARQLYDIK